MTTRSFRSWARAPGPRSPSYRSRPELAKRCSSAVSSSRRSGAWLGWPWGLLLASLLFGLFHPISLTYMIIASILGLYLGLVLYAGGNLISVIVVHAFYDFAALGYLLRIRPALEADES